VGEAVRAAAGKKDVPLVVSSRDKRYNITMTNNTKTVAIDWQFVPGDDFPHDANPWTPYKTEEK